MKRGGGWRHKNKASFTPSSSISISSSSSFPGSCPSSRQYSSSSFSSFSSKIKIGDDEYDEIHEYVNFEPLSSKVRKQRREQARKIIYERKGGDQTKEYLLSPSMKRCGVVALKIGMMGVYDSWGERHTCTVLQLDNVEVTQCKKFNTDGQLSIQLGISEKRAKNTKKPQRGHFEKAGVAPKRRLTEFQVNSEDCLVPLGTKIDVRHFVPGQYVDVQGISKGKGFAGVMKRWNFKGQGATHGVSLTHRSLGSTGHCASPGRVYKGKKMPGHMGAAKVTVLNQQILKLDTERQLLYIKGHVPGPNGGYIRIRDAVQGAKFPSPPPIPTFLGMEEDGKESEDHELFAPVPEENPLIPKVFEE